MINWIKLQISQFFYSCGYGIYKIYPKPSTKFMKEYFEDKEIIGCEIGVYRGLNAKSMDKELKIRKMYLIDPYIKYENYKDGFTDVDWRDLDKAENEAKIKLSNERFIFIKRFSHEAIENIKEELDFVYIDANPDLEYAQRDLELYYKKLKVGGVLAGNTVNPELKIKFAESKGVKSTFDNLDWWVIKK